MRELLPWQADSKFGMKPITAGLALLLLLALVLPACASNHRTPKHTSTAYPTRNSSRERQPSAGRPYYGGGHHTTSHGGHYYGATNGHHRNGHYGNWNTRSRYGVHKPH